MGGMQSVRSIRKAISICEYRQARFDLVNQVLLNLFRELPDPDMIFIELRAYDKPKDD